MQGEKSHVRRAMLNARRAISAADREAANAAIADALLPRAWATKVVAAYVPLADELGTTDLLDAMSISSTVVVPVMLDSRELDWAVWTGAGDLVPSAGGHGLMRPVGPLLGVDYLYAADLVVAPAVAVAHSGQRLGRGGGSYDRALRHLRADAQSVAVVFDDEFVPTLPADDWDVPVRAVLTPGRGWTELPLTGDN